MVQIKKLIESWGFPSALLLGTGGYLRRSVVIERQNQTWTVRHSLWEITLLTSMLDSNVELRSVLERERPLCSLGDVEERVANLLLLLAHQGCFTLDSGLPALDMAAVRYVMQAAVNSWYGSYYAHPLWKKLNSTTLTLSQVFLWALRTYHLSRSAGPTSARGAANPKYLGISRVFLKSCLEEFSHCDDFYFPQHQAFGLTPAAIEDMIPLPASIAFDQQMLSIADRDPLAHLTVAYFQEFTAEFRQNAFDLYNRLEARYGLDGFFEGWKDHVGYDLNHSHSDDLFHALTGDELFQPDQIVRSLNEAGKTVDCLIWALDQIYSLPSDADVHSVRPLLSKVVERVNQKLMRVNHANVTLDNISLIIAEVLSGEDALKRPIPLAYREMKREVLQAVLMHALGFSRSHQEVVTVGRMVELLTTEGPGIVIEPFNSGGEPILNFLWESSRKPLELILSLQTIARIILMTSSGKDDVSAWLRLSESSNSLRIPVDYNDHMVREAVELAYQLLELMESTHTFSAELQIDLFDDLSAKHLDAWSVTISTDKAMIP